MKIYVIRLPRWLSALLRMLRGGDDQGHLNKQIEEG